MAVSKAVTKKHQDHFSSFIKKNVRNFYNGFKHNYNYFYEARRFIYDTSLSDDEVSFLDSIDKPPFKFNITEPFISRQVGEFSKQEPSIYATPRDNAVIKQELLDFVQGHIKFVLDNSKRDLTETQTFEEQMSGGFSVLELYTEYSASMSFDHSIVLKKSEDPTLCGFDLMSKKPHKGDGRFSFKMIPKTLQEAKEEYGLTEKDFSFVTPMTALKDKKGNDNFLDYSWSYRNADGEDIVLYCDWYEKKKEKVHIGKLSTGEIIYMDKYDEFIKKWNEEGILEQPPVVVKERWAYKEKICNYLCVENKVVSYEETDLSILPHIFVDGNSKILKQSSNGSIIQKCRNFVHNLGDTQRLKNMSGQTLGNEMLYMMPHKLMAPIEAFPDEPEFQKFYTDMQKAGIIMYKMTNAENPNVPNNPPTPIPRVPMPIEVMSTFMSCDQLAQFQLGSFDAAIGINDNQLSGKAMMTGAMQSNPVVMPFVNNFIISLNHIANGIKSMIKTYYLDERSVGVMNAKGETVSQKLNSDDGIMIDFDEEDIGISVKAGMNFNVQKQQNLNSMISLAHAMPSFGEFMNEKGLLVMVKNMEVYGGDLLLPLAEEFMQEKAQQKKMQMQAMQQEQQNNPMIIRAKAEIQKAQINAQTEAAGNEVKMMEIKKDLLVADNEMAIQKDKHHTEILKTVADISIAERQHSHKREKEMKELSHKMSVEINKKSRH